MASWALDADDLLSSTTTASPYLDLRSEAGNCAILTAATAENDCASTSRPVLDVRESTERSHCALPSSVRATQETGSTGSGERSRTVGRALHVRIDSLSPLPSMLLAKELEVDTSMSITDNALGSGGSKQSFPIGQGATPARQSIQSRITFLNASHHQEMPVSNQNAPVYAQCCVCLERHGEYNMLEIAACKHRYRELCLKKAIKVGSLRKFHCSSCEIWRAAQKQDTIGMPNSGRL